MVSAYHGDHGPPPHLFSRRAAARSSNMSGSDACIQSTHHSSRRAVEIAGAWAEWECPAPCSGSPKLPRGGRKMLLAGAWACKNMKYSSQSESSLLGRFFFLVRCTCSRLVDQFFGVLDPRPGNRPQRRRLWLAPTNQRAYGTQEKKNRLASLLKHNNLSCFAVCTLLKLCEEA